MFYSKKQKALRNLKKLVPTMFLGLCCNAFAANNLIPPLMEQGMKNYSEQKYRAAADYLGQVVDMDPEHSQARYYLVYSLALSGNNEKALKHAEILAKKFPRDQQYKNLVNQIKAEIAKQASPSKSQEVSSGNVQKEVMIGGYKSMDKNSEMREPNVDYTPREITPPKPLTELEKAIRKIDEEDYDTAEKMLKDIIQNEPNNAGAYHNLGVVYMSRNKFAKAAENFLKASKIEDKKGFQTLFLLADCYRSMGDIDKAEKVLVTANELKYDEFALMNLAQIKIEQGKFKEAEKIYNEVMTKSPTFTEASIGLAQIRIGQGKTDEALTMINQALASGSTGEANYVKGLILLANNMDQEALEQFELAIKSSPNNAKYILGRGSAYLKLYDFTHAMDDASEVLNTNPNSKPAIFLIAEAFILTSSEDEAEERLKGISDNLAEVHRLKGMIAKRRGQDSQARQEYEEYYKKAGAAPAAALEFAEFLESLDNGKSDAITYYNQIIKKFPDSVYATRAKEAIERLNMSDSDSDLGISPDAAFDVGPSNNYRPGNMKY